VNPCVCIASEDVCCQLHPHFLGRTVCCGTYDRSSKTPLTPMYASQDTTHLSRPYPSHVYVYASLYGIGIGVHYVE
jgi:hypothetical protein